MRFCYQYRTKDNALHEGVVSAPCRDAAFATLKERGIRPSRLWDAPGLLNQVVGKGKRWLLIVLLSCFSSVVVYSWKCANDAVKFASEERAQLFGDPYVLKQLSHNGWRDTFSHEGDAWFARHAIPGTQDDTSSTNTNVLTFTKIPILDSDPDELRKMKRMINCMKDEFAAYIKAGGSQDQYIADCDERLRVERTIYQTALRETSLLERKLSDRTKSEIEEEWNKKNAVLRSMGLMTVPFPE